MKTGIINFTFRQTVARLSDIISSKKGIRTAVYVDSNKEDTDNLVAERLVIMNEDSTVDGEYILIISLSKEGSLCRCLHSKYSELDDLISDALSSSSRFEEIYLQKKG